MDIRRLSLWEGRNATYMSNGPFFTLIEDQGEVTLELSVRNQYGARVSPLSIPYFRGTGRSVAEDENGEWWRGRQGLYQAGGSYFSFPSNTEDRITTTGSYWTLRRYGTEDEFGGVWKYSEMKAPEEGYRVGKLDLVIPGHDCLYSAYAITNTGEGELRGNPRWVSVLSSPVVETGSQIATNARLFKVSPLSSREAGINRFHTGITFADLRKAPLPSGGTVDASVVPSPTGTYDWIMGNTSDDSADWISVTNVQDQMVYMAFTSKSRGSDDFSFPCVVIGQNWYGRMDAPWALFDGATPQERSLTVGFSFGPSGSNNFSLLPGETRTCYFGSLFTPLSNQRLGTLGFYTNEVKDEGFLLKRTKNSFLVTADTSFKALRKVSRRIFFRALNESGADSDQ